MSNITSDILNSIRYNFSKKREPKFLNPSKIITNFDELTPSLTSPYDLNGHQLYLSGPTSDGIFNCERMTKEEIDFHYQEFLKYCEATGSFPTPKFKWEYKSSACHSYDKFRINIDKPGRIVVKSTLPRYVCASPWLFVSMNEGDYNNPWVHPIDLDPPTPRNYYFEIDMFETFSGKCQNVKFTGHYNTQNNRKLKSTSLYKNYDDDFHFSEIIWDGNGNWTWLLDSIVVGDKFIPQPKNIYPYFMLTMGMFDPFPSNINSSTWKVEYVKFSDVIIL